MPKYEVFGAKVQEFSVFVDASDEEDATRIVEDLVDITEFDIVDTYTETFDALEVKTDGA